MSSQKRHRLYFPSFSALCRLPVFTAKKLLRQKQIIKSIRSVFVVKFSIFGSRRVKFRKTAF